MELKNSNNEYYYYSEIDDDVLLIFLLKPFFISGSKLENLSSGGRQRQIFKTLLTNPINKPNATCKISFYIVYYM